jgi:deazaflavin-dependent oxidoreductase (nitroreductase family)
MHARLHNTVMRVAGQTLGLLLRRGIRLGPMMLLTVRGRLTGRLRTNPVDLFEDDGRQWLVSTHGVGDSNWVRNLRAAGGGTLARGSRRYSFTAVELSQREAGFVLRDVVGPRLARPVAGFVLRRTLRVRGDASADDFVRTAEQHPVFELALTDAN